jgi:hypothetical protein
MKKTTTVVILLIIAIALIGPKFAGNIFNQQLDQYIESVNSLGVYQVEVKERQQGWFHTQASIEVAIVMPNFPDNGNMSNLQVDLQVQAQHGPMLTQNGIGLGWLSWSVMLLSDKWPADFSTDTTGPVYQANGKMGLLGGTSYQDRMQAFTYTDPATNINFDMQGWQGDGYLTGSHVSYSGESGNISMSMPDLYELELTSSAISMEAQGSLSDLTAGQLIDSVASISLAQMSLNNLLENTNMQMNNLQVDYSIILDDAAGVANFNSDLSLASLTFPGFSLSDMLMKTEVNNLEQAFLTAYQEMNKAVMQEPQRAEEIMQQAMQAHLLPQLMAEPEFNITQLSAVLNEGDINMTSTNKLIGVTSLPDTMENNDFWLEHLASNTQMNVQDSAASFIASMVLETQLAANPQFAAMEPAQRAQLIEQQSAATLDGLVQQGLLTKTPDGYSMSFNMKDGKAKLNENTIPLLD